MNKFGSRERNLKGHEGILTGLFSRNALGFLNWRNMLKEQNDVIRNDCMEFVSLYPVRGCSLEFDCRNEEVFEAEHLLDNEGVDHDSVWFSSTLKKRRKKMNKHKLKKRRKRERARAGKKNA